MKRKLLFFFACLIIVAIGVGGLVSVLTKYPVESIRAKVNSRGVERYVHEINNDQAGYSAGLITFGLGTMIGVPLIVRSEKRRNNQS